MRKAALAALSLFCIAAPAGAVEPWLIVRPGMDVKSHEPHWREKCGSFVLTDNKDEENYLTCVYENGDAATANIAPSGIAWWASYQDASGGSREAFVSRVVQELALTTDTEACSVFGGPAQCWTAGTMRVGIEHEATSGRWIVVMEDRTIFDPDGKTIE